MSGLKISGFVSRPDFTRSSKKDYYTFVNSRAVKCPVFQKSIDTAYRNLIGSRYPFVILNLEISPEDVDVNVHPTKIEVRFSDNFNSFSRLQTTVGISYKISKILKAGVGYALINPYSSNNNAFKNSRHRLMADFAAGYRMGDWRLSLRERIQMTHLTGDYNTYQQPRNAFMLKSRLTAKYHWTPQLVPYAYVEFRHFLNAPVITAVYDGSTYSSPTGSQAAGWFLDGFNGSYLNRVRTSLGIDIPMSKKHQFKFYLLADYVSDKVVDANAKGTKLKSYTKEHGWVGWAGAEYEFRF